MITTSSGAPYAEELENNIDLLIHDQDIRQRRFPGDQNRAEGCYGEEAYSHCTATRKANMYFNRLAPTK